MAGARALDEETLARRRRLLGDDHPDTLTSAGNLAAVLAALGDWETAAGLYRQAWDGFRRKLGPAHPHTLKAGRSLDQTLEQLGRPPVAQLTLPASEKTDSQK